MTSLPIITAEPCRGCGACCMDIIVPPFDTDDDNDTEFNALPVELQEEIERWWDQHCDEDGNLKSLGDRCVWFDYKTRRCRNYDLRPLVCREFEPGSLQCMEWREGNVAALGPDLAIAPILPREVFAGESLFNES